MNFKKLLQGNVVIVGVGNELLGDDGVGVYVARKLRGRNVINAGVAPENFTGKVKRMMPERIVIFDALEFGGKSGEVKIVDARRTQGLKISTHSLPLSFFSELFGKTEIYVVGIQPKSKEFGGRMSGEVRKSADRLIEEAKKSSD